MSSKNGKHIAKGSWTAQRQQTRTRSWSTRAWYNLDQLGCFRSTWRTENTLVQMNFKRSLRKHDNFTRSKSLMACVSQVAESWLTQIFLITLNLPLSMQWQFSQQDAVDEVKTTFIRRWLGIVSWNKRYLRGLVIATFSLLSSVTKPSFPWSLFLTEENTMMSASLPW